MSQRFLDSKNQVPPSPLSRRQFVTGALAATTIFGVAQRDAHAQTLSPLPSNSLLSNLLPEGSSQTSSLQDMSLQGTEFDLNVGARVVNFTGKSRLATVVNDSLPAPLLRFREGDTVTLRVNNRLSVPTSIHWHGMIVPADMDGVPGLSFDGIPSGASFVYRFEVKQSGTYWYHSHSRFQEQTGLYGPIVIEPRGGERHQVDRDYVLLLSDWTDTDPERIYRTLKRDSDYFNFSKPTVADFIADVRREGLTAAIGERRMWNRMRMNPNDLADVSGYTYTYLTNGKTPQQNWMGLFMPGEKIRLRIINGSSMSTFDVRVPGLEMQVIAADGQDIEPVTVEEFRIGSAEVYDVIVQPLDARAYTIFAQSIDRSGFARGTLAPHAGMQAEIPPLNPQPLLSMQDMGQNKMNHEMPMTMPMTMDSNTMQPRTNLDDPGVGLRNNGRRVLSYADLHTLGGPLDTREAQREIILHLTGQMQRYIWSFNGEKFSAAKPLRFNYGERLRLVLINDSMMAHPIHLHGMWSELETHDGKFQVRKHTVLVQPGQRLSYLITADALGHWAYHCHLLYHMEAGMFREVIVAKSQGTRS